MPPSGLFNFTQLLLRTYIENIHKTKFVEILNLYAYICYDKNAGERTHIALT